MRKIILTLLLLPMPVLADDFDQWLVDEALGRNKPQQTEPSYGLPLQPMLPVPQDRGPNGTGYSIVTTTRPTKNLWDRDVTGSETVQRIVPNNSLGQPIKGVDPLNW
jgi:hypothetical protein